MYYLFFASKMLLAILLGGALGWQREKIGKSAGPRTYALVCVGSALFTVLSLYGFGVMGDTARVAAQILTGIGFLGAGLIIHKDGATVSGLTTAAGLWVVAAVGMAIGVGWYIEATIVTLLILVVFVVDDNKLVKSRKNLDKKKELL